MNPSRRYSAAPESLASRHARVAPSRDEERSAAAVIASPTPRRRQPGDRLGDAPLAQVTERLTPWADGQIDTDLSPGVPTFRDPNLRGLAAGLLQTGMAAVGTGVAGNAAWELIKKVADG